MDEGEIEKAVIAYLKKKGFKQTELALQEEQNKGVSSLQTDPEIAKQILSFAEMTTTSNEHAVQMNKNMKWTPRMDRAFIAQLHKFGVELRNNNGLTKERWNAISRDLTTGLGFQIDVKHLKNHYKGWKANYTQVRDLRSLNGFGWDDARKLVDAEAGVWAALIKARPTLGKWRYQSFPLYEDMAMLMGDSHATGDLAITYNEPGYADDSTPAEATELESGDLYPGTNAPNANQEGRTSSQSVHSRGVNPSSERATKRKKKGTEDKLFRCFEAMTETLSRMTENDERERKEITIMKDVVLGLPEIDIANKLKAMTMLANNHNMRKLFLDLGEEYRRLWLVSELGL